MWWSDRSSHPIPIRSVASCLRVFSIYKSRNATCITQEARSPQSTGIMYIQATGKTVMKTGGSDMCNTNGAEYTLRRLGIWSLKERRCCHGKLEALVGAFSYSEGHHALKHGVVVTDGTSVASGYRHREMQHRAALCQPARGEVDPGSDLGSSTSQLRTVKVRRRKQEVTATYTTAISKLLDQLVKLPVICRPIYAPQQHHRGLSLIDPCLDIEC